jgi:hypothetical protein
MPLLDVSDVLTDPDIAGERLEVVRRFETVNGFGESVVTTKRYAVRGSVTPVGDNSLIREEAYQAEAQTILVVTAFLLRGPSKNPAGQSFQPDVILWLGDSYVVRVLNDYSRYGAGMVEAECSSIDFIDEAPRTGPTI